MIFIYWSIKH